MDTWYFHMVFLTYFVVPLSPPLESSYNLPFILLLPPPSFFYLIIDWGLGPSFPLPVSHLPRFTSLFFPVFFFPHKKVLSLAFLLEVKSPFLFPFVVCPIPPFRPVFFCSTSFPLPPPPDNFHLILVSRPPFVLPPKPLFSFDWNWGPPQKDSLFPPPPFFFFFVLAFGLTPPLFPRMYTRVLQNHFLPGHPIFPVLFPLFPAPL